MMTFTCAQKIDLFRAWVFFTVVLPSKAILPYGNSITFETALKVLIYNQGNFESREKERGAWIPGFHTCLYVRSHFFIFWIWILNSQFYTPSTPHLAKPAKTWLILSTFWAIVLSRENRNWQKFSGKEYGKMIGRWTNWHNIKIVSRKWIWRNDLKMANWHNSIIIFRKRIWKDDAQLCS